MVSSSSEARPHGLLGDNLIPIINRIQDIFSQVTIDLKLNLPQVAVIGSQSSGKSSVLESLVGRDFLPRGSDIVTRRPLVLQLIKVAQHVPSSVGAAPLPSMSPASMHGEGGKQNESEWGEFLHLPGKQFHDFDQITEEIKAETDRVAAGKNVSDKPIRLKIFSPHVLTMTLVDLPGMTKVPVGDQPSNIEQKIRDMVLEYIRQPSCIILAVSPANADLANSDALHMAQMVDPEGVRTVGVLTKLDIMDRGTDASHIMKNHHIPLRLGYVGIINRSQADINSKSSMADARKAEEAFFHSHSEYREVAGQCGVANLARRLNAILVEHIRVLLPGLRRRITEAMERRTDELHALGDPQPLQGKTAKGAYLLQLLCDYADRFAAMLDGRHQDFSTSQLTGGARVRYVFNEMFGRSVKELAPSHAISDGEISTVIKNGAGVSGNLLVPQEPFELLVRRAIHQLLGPSLSCKEAVYEELLRIAEQACPKEAARFPHLQRALASSILEFIKSGADPAESMIRSLVACETDYINCDHSEFIGGRGAIRAVMQERGMRSHAALAAAVTDGSGDSKDGSGNSGMPRNSKQMMSDSALVVAGSSKGGRGNNTTPASKSRSNSANVPTGLKGMADPVPHSSNELLTRTRRRSGENFHSTNYMVSNDSPGAGTGWFTWFSRPSEGRSDGQGGDGQYESHTDDGMALSPSPLGGGHFGSHHTSHAFRLRSEQEDIEVEVIRKLVDSYFNIVRKSMLDQVPKAIMHFMVNNTKRGLQQHLIQQLYRDEILDDLLSERMEVVTQRRACQEALSALQQATKALEELPGELTSYSMTNGLGASQPSLQHAFESMALASGNDSLMGQPLRTDRSPSMAVAARVATVALSALQGDSRNMLDVVS